MGRFTFLLPFVAVITIFLSSKVDATNFTTTNESNTYTLDTDGDIVYARKSIIEQLDDVSSRVECFLQCSMKEGCRHLVVSEKEKRCKLLKDILINPDVDVKDGEKVYSLVGEFLIVIIC